VLVVAVIAVAVVLNIIVSLVPGTYTKLDTTQDKLYALSDDAKELISGYDTDIEIIYIVEEDNVDSVVKELLERAAAINSHITLTQIDPVLHPELVTDYSSYNENSFVVKSDKHKGVILENDLLYTLLNGKTAQELSDFDDAKYFVTAKIENIPSDEENISIIPFVALDGAVYYGGVAE
jgi:hypothetical protein